MAESRPPPPSTGLQRSPGLPSMVHRSGADQRCPSPVKLISILAPVPIGFVATAKTAVRQRWHPMAAFDPLWPFHTVSVGRIRGAL